ncbi:hypothetical protein [uncultured Pseudomonas sp.]|jgi:hypothetical protein|uniref:hypothetical protein n=1 Tax=uncultured Pseudomonas sp. TaxID=114707 RepID=UPI0030D6D70F|tara:strand:+ start:1065 stop:1235 length:171 start_codon:yes stop_codon:yes gene_type:complete
MSDKDDQSQSSDQETSAEPDRNTPPPEVTFVLDHKIPEIEKRQQQINESGVKDRRK